MAIVTFTLEDTPAGGVSVRTDFKPAIGRPCTLAQSAALEILSRTRRDYGLDKPTSTPAAASQPRGATA